MRIDHTMNASTVTDKVAPKILCDAFSAGFEGKGGIPAAGPPKSSTEAILRRLGVVLGWVRVVVC
jgi:hypothetical protein